jgi:hypothetical protein
VTVAIADTTGATLPSAKTEIHKTSKSFVAPPQNLILLIVV